MGRRLFAPLNPLRLNLPDDFFQRLPQLPGVYRMYDEQGALLYVGKAKNLRDRLRSYRTPTDLDLPRKVQRLLHQVRRIEFEICANEASALVHEGFLIRTLKPPYNHVGKFPERYSYVNLVFDTHEIHWKITHDKPEPSKDLRCVQSGAFKGRSWLLQGLSAVLRRVWTVSADSGEPPLSLLNDRLSIEGSLNGLSLDPKHVGNLKRFFRGTSDAFLKFEAPSHLDGFRRYCFSRDLEILKEFYKKGPQKNASIRRKLQLSEVLIPSDRLEELAIRASQLGRLRKMD